jgi:hypothetical protein
MTYTVIHTGRVRGFVNDAARPWALVRVDGGERCLGRYTTRKAAHTTARLLAGRTGKVI